MKTALTKPALAVAIVGASLSLFQAFGPATARGDGAAFNTAARLGAAAPTARRAAPDAVHFSSMAEAGDVRPLVIKLQPAHLPVSGRGGAAPFDGIVDAGSIEPLAGVGSTDSDAAALAAAAALRSLQPADPWATAGGIASPPMSDGLGFGPASAAASGFDSVALSGGEAVVFVPPAEAPAAIEAPAVDAGQPGPSGNTAAIMPEPGLAVGTVPEPTTWAMLIAGMAMVGINLRRRGPRDVLA
ncbi:PEPxxWA-CTERM sorting domain-containing protein [Sandarakinorhabdus sp. DWP1-3-1]|uniref:PEPxxWA-CTERM sorting domain-containing protein n=1 Tax=Sandarakinorhabdus sp. DWP1-3-1 TaxID=2804627 RepID=UPI003CECED1B